MSESHTRVNRTDRLDTQLLSAARSEVAPDEVRARVAARLGLVAAASLAAGGLGGVEASGKAALGAAKFGGGMGMGGVGASSAAAVKLLSVVVGVVVLGGSVALVRGERPAAVAMHAAPAAPVAIAAVAAKDVAPSLPRAEGVGPAELSVGGTDVQSGREHAQFAPPPPPPRGAVAAGTAVPGSVAEELLALDAAHALLREARPTDALRAISRYLRKFPNGSMLPEAQLLEIDALRASGDNAGASRKTVLFLQAHPDSPGAQRLQSERPL